MGNILTLTPALTISQSEMDRAIQILDDCLQETEEFKERR
jgi:4-aminobutyrate aminotransferase-like enzyme